MTHRVIVRIVVVGVALTRVGDPQSTESCEIVAVERWNRFAQTSDRYLQLRQRGIRNARERSRMESQFREVMSEPCF
jgi:hypothetical protein